MHEGGKGKWRINERGECGSEETLDAFKINDWEFLPLM
jgi:hypothetical protein